MDKLKQNGYLYAMNQPNGTLIGNQYPKHRPLHIYRKRGKAAEAVVGLNGTNWLWNEVPVHVAFGTFWYTGYGYVPLQRDPVAYAIGSVTYTLVSNDGLHAVWRRSDDETTVMWINSDKPPCEPRPTYVKQYKMLGKKLPDHSAAPTCCPDPLAPRGTLSSFSGRAQIRPATTLSSGKYFSETSQYLRSRGDSYHVNQVLAKIPGVMYVDGADAIWPNQTQIVDGEILDSSMFETCAMLSSDGTCSKTRTIYKPSNTKFANQGAVSAGERLLRLKTENPVTRTTMTGKKLR